MLHLRYRLCSRPSSSYGQAPQSPYCRRHGRQYPNCWWNHPPRLGGVWRQILWNGRWRQFWYFGCFQINGTIRSLALITHSVGIKSCCNEATNFKRKASERGDLRALEPTHHNLNTKWFLILRWKTLLDVVFKPSNSRGKDQYLFLLDMIKIVSRVRVVLKNTGFDL